MPVSQGTRTTQRARQERIDQGHQTRTLNRDLGLSKNVTAAVTFVAGTSQLQAANGTFANFAAGDDILVEGVALNNGYFHVTAIDGANHAFLTVDPPPAAEGPLAATVRST